MRKKPMSRRCEYCIDQPREEPKKCTCSPGRPRTHQSMTSYRRKDINSSVLTNHSKELKELESQTSELRLLANDNSRLKAENSRLRRDMQRMQPSDMSNETLLQDRLYQSNKALQEAILNLDLCGRANKELEDKLTHLKVSYEQIKIERQGLVEQLEKYKGKLKRSIEMARNSRMKEDPESRTSQGLLEKYTELARKNKQLQIMVEQMQEEMSRTSAARPQFGWARKTAKKINSIEQNITRIEQNHEQIEGMKEQLQSLQSEFRHKIDVVASCQDYLDKQFATAIRGCSPATEFMRSFQFVQLNRVVNMMQPGQLKDLVSKLNMSALLSKLLNGLTQHMSDMSRELFTTLQAKLRRVQSQFKTAQRKLTNLAKLISNNRMKSRTERTRMRHISLSSKLDFNKENIDTNN